MSRYQQRILAYLYENFSFERASEIDDTIIEKAASLSHQPLRGRKEDFLLGFEKDFRFILHKETKHFEVKIVYYIDEAASKIYVTDFFPTKMNPQKIREDHR